MYKITMKALVLSPSIVTKISLYVPTLMASRPFLSCLCGSEPDPQKVAMAVILLSCLCGSEHTTNNALRITHLLSCLCGSEPLCIAAPAPAFLLSCLCGSEQSEGHG